MARATAPSPTTRPAGRVVRVLPDVAGIDKAFDYLVPASWDAEGDERGRLVRVGSLVRVDLHGRRVGAWVLADDVDPPPGVTLRPLAKVTGLGPPAEIVALARWVASRWCGKLASVLTSASPPTAVRGLPAARPRGLVPAGAGGGHAAVFDSAAASGRPVVLRVPPAADTFDVVQAAIGRGNALVLTPSVDDARSVATRLRRLGVPTALHPRDWALGLGGATVVGARAAVLAPVHDLAAIVVLDEHAEAYQEERMPTWHARTVAVERARRAGVPCVLTSPAPTLDALALGDEHAPSRAVERAGWPIVDIVDRRRDATVGLFSERIVPFVRGEGPVVCVLNRTGRSKLLACGACGELARCEACRAAVAQADDGSLVCSQCATRRPLVCNACGSQRLKNLRLGVTRAAEELAALASRPVVEVTAATGTIDRAGALYIGTEAVLHQLPHARVVIFLDFDQELLAPRVRVAEQAMALLVRAARLVGGRDGGGRVVVQTRLARHEVLDAALHADPRRLVGPERAKRELLRFPPACALAVVSGAAAPAFVDRLMATTADRTEVLGPIDGRYLVRAADHRMLTSAINATERPPGRLRIEVDPQRI